MDSTRYTSNFYILHQEVPLHVKVALQFVLGKGRLLNLGLVVALEQSGVRTIVVVKNDVLRNERLLKDKKVERPLCFKVVI
mgnify:CR=1 FL=1